MKKVVKGAIKFSMLDIIKSPIYSFAALSSGDRGHYGLVGTAWRPGGLYYREHFKLLKAYLEGQFG